MNTGVNAGLRAGADAGLAAEMPADAGNVAEDQAVRDAALDPGRSFIVQAPAGSGKTELLTRRVLTLLAHVDEPEQVLAITFTRKAASEMRQRVIEALQDARDAEDSPSPTAHAATGRALAEAVLARDAARDWQLLSNPQRLNLSTIDGLCTRLAHRLPVVSLLGAPAAVAEDASGLYQDAARRLLDDPDEPLDLFLLQLGNRLEEAVSLLAGMLARRDQWLRYGLHQFDPDALRAQLQQMLDQLIAARLEALRAQVPERLADDLMSLLAHATRVQGQLQLAAPDILCDVALPGVAPSDVRHWEALARLLLTGAGQLRKRVTRAEGFPTSKADAEALDTSIAELKAHKERMTTLCTALADHPDFTATLADVRGLPQDGYSDEDWALLAQLIAVLPGLRAHLHEVFSHAQKIDFVEMALRARLALGSAEEPTDLALALDVSLRHILVDEFQDTSQSQFELFEQLVAGWQPDDGHSFFAVGDPMQSIYRFRDGDVSLFLRASEEGVGEIPLQPLRLTVNFRAVPAVVDWVNQTFSSIFPAQADATIGAVPYAASTPHLGGAGTVNTHPLIDASRGEEAKRVASIVSQAVAGDSEHRVAILLRSRSQAVEIFSALQAVGIPYLTIDMDLLGERPVVRDLLALCIALRYPQDRLHWLAVLRAPWCGLTLHDLHAVTEGAVRDASVFELAQEEARQAALSDDGRQRLQRLLSILAPAVRQVPRSALIPWVEACWIALGGPATCAGDVDLQAAERCLCRLESLEQAGELNQPSHFVHAMASLYAEVPDDGTVQVQVMTLHKAKGLEFDTVVLPALDRRSRGDGKQLLNWFESSIEGETQLMLAPVSERKAALNPLNALVTDAQRRMNEQESLRLLYVACTRAKSNLHLLANRSRRQDGSLGQPVRQSLLHPLWPQLQGVFEAEAGLLNPAAGDPAADEEGLDAPAEVLKDAQVDDGQVDGLLAPAAAAAVLAEAVQPPLLYRLPADWVLPDLQPYQWPATPTETAAVGDAVAFRWAGTAARDIGTVVHRQLQNLASAAAGLRRPDRLADTARQQLVQLGMPSERLDEAAAQVVEAIDRTLADERGRWVLDAGHQDARSEWALSAVIGGEIKRVIVDRTFVDDEGVRWIIDFKTGRHTGGGLEAFLETELKRYQDQLQGYADIIGRMENRPVMAGLYFPLMAQWCSFKPAPVSTETD